ncbi:Replication factor C small subunit [Spraguea lophii 42_110]|uniref:Replication factor C small subunit n=1 Tax=Spraguea lophii (strain 42_110) TaxID=1358809 RepID=S7XVK4_SPRLO|nr:Replication factor C small subunit [Spraguea lophii 42_110]
MQLWTEKYRPKNVEAFISNEHIKKLLEYEDYPNLLLYGPPGTGKTTFAHLLSKKFLELNASDERGIAVVRNKIKTYASGMDKKTIILDECDHLTVDAQQCLRRIIEDFSSSTRFIFIANSLPKIIQPIKSRLLKIKFECIEENYTKLKDIGDKENLNLQMNENQKAEWYKKIFMYCRYDLRRSINFLQGISFLQKQNEGKEFSIEEFFGVIPSVEEFYRLGKDNIDEYINSFKKNSYSLLQLVYQLNNNQLEGEKKAKFHQLLSLIEYRLMVGCSTNVLLHHLCYAAVSILN